MLAKDCLEEFKVECDLRRLSPRTTKGYYDELKADLNKILKACEPSAIPCTYPIKSLGRALPYFGYSVAPFGKHGTGWHITKVCTTK